MSKSFLLAIDQGTTSSRFIVFDREGRIIAQKQREHAQIYPRPGQVEHDPLEIWRNTQAVMTEALEEAGLTPESLLSIGITNQRETTLLWNRRTGEPLHNAIVWQDRRTEPAYVRLRERGAEALVRERTGLVIDA